MELEYLRDFVVLSKTNNYLEAADELFIAQSSLTRHIQKMEKELGIPLFKRTSRKVELSEHGKMFLPYALKIVEIYDKYLSELYANTRRENKVIFACNKALAPYDFGIVMSEFRESYPKIDLEYEQPAKPLEKLQNNLIDFLLIGKEFIPKGDFNIRVISKDSFVVVVSSRHRLANWEKVSIKSLAEEKIVLPSMLLEEEGSFMTACKTAGITPECIATDTNEILDMAAVGGYVVLIPKRLALYYTDLSVSLVELDPEISTELAVVYRKSPELTEVEKHFLDFITEIFNQNP